LSFQAQIEKTIREFELLDKNQAILVALSAGLDSVVLTHALIQLGYKISIAHVNFKLRGKDSDQDEAFARSLSKKYDVPYFKKTLRINSKKEPIQLAARNARYKWFNEILRKKGFDRIALGHNADDNFETALFHLIKGEGIMNHRGIPMESGEFVRPLLLRTRKEILAYAKKEGLIWREDKSNKESKYHRNYLRNKVLPQIRKINPSIETSFQRDYLRGLDLRQMLGKELGKKTWLKDPGGTIRIDLEKLKREEGWFFRLEYFLKDHGYSSEKFWELKKLVDAESGKFLSIGNNKLWKDRNDLLVRMENEPKKTGIISIKKLPFHKNMDSGKIELKFTALPGQVRKVSNPNKIFLDAAKLVFPLKIRRWKKGDEFQPLGTKGRKKISDFLIDQKVPMFKKEKIRILESGGEIAWVIGMRISEKFKLRTESKKAVEGRIDPPD
jgi:tRNA(Ile)-lysidine synthase